jgi:hypothetical protein
MRPLLGDFLAAAREHIDAATSDIPQLSADAAPTVVKELDRLTAVMARTANAFVVDDDMDRPEDLGGSDPWEDAESCQHSGSTPMSCASAR